MPVEIDELKKDIQLLKTTAALTQKDVGYMKCSFDEFKDEVKKSIKAYYALFGIDGQTGLVKDFSDYKKEINDLKLWKAKVVATSSIIGSSSGFLLSYLIK